MDGRHCGVHTNVFLLDHLALRARRLPSPTVLFRRTRPWMDVLRTEYVGSMEYIHLKCSGERRMVHSVLRRVVVNSNRVQQGHHSYRPQIALP